MTLATFPRYDREQIPEQRGRAVVVGAGVAGLVTARVLADAFSEVTVIDRDSFPTEPITRRGVPQGAQPHALWESGRATLEALFPGFSEELLAAGAVRSELGNNFKNVYGYPPSTHSAEVSGRCRKCRMNARKQRENQ